MNIYEKIAKARVLYAEKNIKKSGKNDYAGYSYYELCDILPAINTIGAELGFLCEVSFTDVMASMAVRNTEKPEDVAMFTSPMSKASLKGCHEVQNLGAVQTYIKRYLYQNAFEIVESDALNATHNPNEKPAPKPAPPAQNHAPKADPEAADKARCMAAQKKLGYDDAKMRELRGAMSYKAFAEKLEGLVIAKELAPDEQAIMDQATRNVQAKLGEPVEPDQPEIF